MYQVGAAPSASAISSDARLSAPVIRKLRGKRRERDKETFHGAHRGAAAGPAQDVGVDQGARHAARGLHLVPGLQRHGPGWRKHLFGGESRAACGRLPVVPWVGAA